MVERGKYIVIEGSDGTGKSRQAIQVSSQLQTLGYDSLLVYNDETGNMEPVQEPGGTPEANLIRARIKDASIPRTPWENVEWFTEARQLIWRDAINPALEGGKWVVAARSWISTVAYQGYGQGINIDAIWNYTYEKVGYEYMTPDLLIILALQNEVVRKKRLSERDQNSSLDTFESMPEQFQHEMQGGYVRFASDNNIAIIDADQTPEMVNAAIWKQINQLLGER
jgi:dTMP kinase